MEKPQQDELYRDELNFAEFPLSSLGSRSDGRACLTFSDTIFDKGLGREVTRKLTISPSAQHGLPMAVDDEVILGLLQLTSQQRFVSRTVQFTRYELIRLLGWPDTSGSYNRIKESLFRWLGVTLQYEKAWWSKADQCWVDKGFHLLDDVQLLDRRSAVTQSSFTWNETVFRSFESGYLKKLDFEFYRSLKSDLAKRLYRFLDKRFYRSEQVDFPLAVLAFEHLGVARCYHTGGLKRLLRKPVEELEERQFLKKDRNRFVQESRGQWKVRFAHQQEAIAPSPEPALVEELVSLGLVRKVAEGLIGQFPAEQIRRQIAAVTQNRPRIRNLAGYLVKAIRDDFPAPAGEPPRPKSKVLRLPEVDPPTSQELKERHELDEFLSSLSEEERKSFESEAVANAEAFLARQYRSAGEGSLFQTVRRQILQAHFRRRVGCAAGTFPP